MNLLPKHDSRTSDHDRLALDGLEPLLNGNSIDANVHSAEKSEAQVYQQLVDELKQTTALLHKANEKLDSAKKQVGELWFRLEDQGAKLDELAHLQLQAARAIIMERQLAVVLRENAVLKQSIWHKMSSWLHRQ